MQTIVSKNERTRKSKYKVYKENYENQYFLFNPFKSVGNW